MGIFGKSEVVASPEAAVAVTKQIDEAAKAKNDALRAARKAALASIVAYVKALKDTPVDIADALKVLQPLRNRGSGITVETVQDRLNKLLNGRKFFTGPEAYAAHRWGASDLRRQMTLALKTGAPADRLWLTYNAQADEVQLAGTGANAPIGWTGYVPVDAAV